MSRIPDDIDLYSGGMTEKVMPESLVGPVFKCILERQFQRLMNGDRFWYQTSDPDIGFSKGIFKVRKTAKIRNQYNQVPHLTKDTTWESNKIAIRHHKKEP